MREGEGKERAMSPPHYLEEVYAYVYTGIFQYAEYPTFSHHESEAEVIIIKDCTRGIVPDRQEDFSVTAKLLVL